MENRPRKSEVRRFAERMGLFLSPFILLWSVETFILPVNFFTFRVWEALLVKRYLPDLTLPPDDTLNPVALTGPFYPNMHIITDEVGGLAQGTPEAVKKRVEWWTDRYGYRKRDTSARPEVVIVGDSFTAGMCLTQSDTLAVVLQGLLNREVYPLATANINNFLRIRRFRESPPKVVVLAVAEGNFSFIFRAIEPVKTESVKWWSPLESLLGWINGHKHNRVFQSFLVFVNRATHPNMYEYVMARLWKAKPDPMIRRGAMIYRAVPRDIDGPIGENPERTIWNIIGYRNVLRTRGIRLIVMPIPSKESVHYREALEGKKPLFLDRLNRGLRERGIEVVDLWNPFMKAHETLGMPLYFPDDTHWNPPAVRIAANLLSQAIRKGGY